MAAPTLKATGPLGKPPQALAYLLASSATFRSLVNAADAAAALAHIHCEADDRPESDAPRPRAIVRPWLEYREAKVALGAFAPAGHCMLCFELYPSDDYVDNLWDQQTEFCNRIDTIRSECWAIQGQGTGYFAGETHLSLSMFELLDGPTSLVETMAAVGEQRRDYFYAAAFVVGWKG